MAKESDTPDFVKECKREKEEKREGGKRRMRERKIDREKERERIGRKTRELYLVITEWSNSH